MKWPPPGPDSVEGDASEAARLAAMLEHLGEAVIGLTPEGTIVTFNAAAERLFGYAAADVVGRPVHVLFGEEHGEDLERLERGATAGIAAGAELSGVRQDGIQLDVVVTLSVVPGFGLSLVVRDVTEERNVARSLADTLESLQGALREARRQAERCSQLADAAHQVRTPISGVAACAEALLNDPPPAERHLLVGEILRGASEAGRVVGRVLEMAKIDQGRPLFAERCDLASLCAAELQRVRIVVPGLRIDLHVEDGASVEAEVDAHAVRHILTNLLDNARRHAVHRVEVRLRRVGEMVELRVTDDGAGVPDEFVEVIFDRFASLDRKGGAGLGLAIARALAEAHGGDLRYEQRAFVLRLPVKARPPAPATGRPTAPGRGPDYGASHEPR